MIFIILPAYNEAMSLPILLPGIEVIMNQNNYDYKVILVNDGSKDDTLRIANEFSSKMPMEIITHKFNRGLGETIRDGFEYAAEHSSPEDTIVRLDCDITHDPQYIPALIEKI